MLLDTFIVVPDLALACARSLECYGQPPGTGVKKLRLLSQGMRLALQEGGAVQGYTLLLADKAQQSDPKLVKFLSACRLLRLCVTVPSLASSNGDGQSIKLAAANQAHQIKMLIASIGPSLLSVTHLTLTLPSTTGFNSRESAATKAAAAMLLPLASACPHLQHLHITGRVGSSFLQHFGSICPNLHSLSAILTNLSPATLKNLQTLLPHITSLSAIRKLPQPASLQQLAEDMKAEEATDQEALITVIKKLASLTCLDTGSNQITEETWKAMPAGLHTLTSHFPSSFHHPHLRATGEWKANASLCKLYITSGKLTVTPLAALLAAAPNLQAIHFGSCAVINVTLSRASALGMQAIDNCISKGLVLTGTHPASENQTEGPCSMSLAFRVLCRSSPRHVTDEGSHRYSHPMAVFMAEHMDRPLHNFSKLEFSHRAGEGGAAADLANLPRVFPNVKQLKVENLCLKGSDMRVLAECLLLQQLDLVTVEGVGGKPLRLLCSEHQTLQRVTLYGCAGITEEQARKIVNEGNKLSGVEVSVTRGQVLEANDARLQRKMMWGDDRIPDKDSNSDGDSDTDGESSRDGEWDRDENRPSRCWIGKNTDWM